MAAAMEEATSTTLKSSRGEAREFQVETRLVMEECSALRDKIHANNHVEVDLDTDILEMVVSFLNLRKMMRDQFPSDYTASQERLRLVNLSKMKIDQFPGSSKEAIPKNKCIQEMEQKWVESISHGKYTPTFAKLMTVCIHYNIVSHFSSFLPTLLIPCIYVFNVQAAYYDLKCESLTEVLAEWIVGKMEYKYSHEINAFFGIECDFSEEELQKHREEYDWAYRNLEESLERKRKTEMGIHKDDNQDVGTSRENLL